MKFLFKSDASRKERANFAAFAVFMLLLFFMGGGSRPDLQSSILLRPIAALFAIYAIAMMTRENLQFIRFPLIILGSIAVWMAIQLIPLPQSIWSALPHRQLYVDIQQAAGLGEVWRPISLDPARTWNSLYAIMVPIAGLLLFSLQPPRSYQRVLIVILSLSLLSAAWGIMQIASGPSGPLYLYRITNNGMLVGLFANRNHQALLLAMLIVMLAHFGSQRSGEGHMISPMRMWLSVLGCMVTLSLVLLTGSRAGLALSMVAMVIAIGLFYRGMALQTNTNRRRARSGLPVLRSLSPQKLITIALGGVAVLILGIFYYASRSTGLDRLVDNSANFELRSQIAPILIQMARDFAPLGSGFGSFQHVYLQYEPIDLLRVNYVNNAHNDIMQLLIEGGLPALLIALGGLGYVGVILWRLFRDRAALWSGSWTRLSTIILCVSVLVFAVAGSIFDYPLRTPTLSTLVTIYVAILAVIAANPAPVYDSSRQRLSA